MDDLERELVKAGLAPAKQARPAPPCPAARRPPPARPPPHCVPGRTCSSSFSGGAGETARFLPAARLPAARQEKPARRRRWRRPAAVVISQPGAALSGPRCGARAESSKTETGTR